MTDGRAPPCADAGWTLIELLVGLVLLALISMLITNSVFSSRRVIDHIEARNGAISVEMVENYLRHALAEAQPVKAVKTAVDAPLIDAGRDRLRLVTSYSPAGQFGGLYEIDLERAPNGRGTAYDLVETRTLYRPQSDPGMPEPSRPSGRSHLIRNVSGIGFRYFGVRGEDDAPGWGEDWTDPTRLPEMVEITVMFSGGDDRGWLPLIVAMPVGR